MARVTAIFDDRSQAERAISELRRRGVPDAELSVVSRRPDDDTTGERIGKGALAGAGVGTLFGLAAAFIPGIGPFLAAGTLASTLGIAGASAAAGAVVGGTSGALAGAFAKAGYSKEEAEFYGPAVERGAVLVAVEAGSVSPERLRTDLIQLGGRAYGATRPTGGVDVRPEV